MPNKTGIKTGTAADLGRADKLISAVFYVILIKFAIGHIRSPVWCPGRLFLDTIVRERRPTIFYIILIVQDMGYFVNSLCKILKFPR